MKIAPRFISGLLALAAAWTVQAAEPPCKPLLNYSFPELITGKPQSLCNFAGKVVLVVNTASQCGYTPQYKGLQELYTKYEKEGLVILGVPANDFGKQEPGSEAEIGAFCEKNFGVSFPLFAKIDVNGDGAHPLYRHLKQEAPGVLGTQSVKWNFTKFLVGRNGQVIKRYAPADAAQHTGAVLSNRMRRTRSQLTALAMSQARELGKLWVASRTRR